MQGRRISSPYDASGALVGEPAAPGDYYFQPDAGWFACTPDGQLAGLGHHAVMVHNDSTITVSPSILVRSGEATWHGFLERGVWRTV